MAQLTLAAAAIGVFALSCAQQASASIPPWPSQWSAEQIIHIPELGAVQSGAFVYDFTNKRVREDQYTSVGTVPTYSKNMSEWFLDTDWYFVDWVNLTCQHADFGVGPVRPDWFLNNSTNMPSTFIWDRFMGDGVGDYHHVNWLRLGWFGVFEYHVDANTSVPVRLRMPGATSLAGMTLMVDLANYTTTADPKFFDLPNFCSPGQAVEVPLDAVRSPGWMSQLAQHTRAN